MVKPGHPLHTAPPADMQRRGTCAAAPAHMYLEEVWLGQPQGEPSWKAERACTWGRASLLVGRSQSHGGNMPRASGGVILNQGWLSPTPILGRFGDIQKQFQLSQQKRYYWHPKMLLLASFNARTAPRPPENSGVLGKALKKNTKCQITNLKAQVYITGKETPYSQMK